MRHRFAAALLFSLALAAGRSAGAATIDTDPSLLAYWQLNDAAGSSTVADAGPTHGYTGTVASGTTLGVASASPGLGTAATFNGSTGKIDVAYSGNLNPGGDFSLSLWANVAGGQGAFRSAVTSRDGTAGVSQGFILYASNANAWEFWTGNGTGWDIATGPAVQLNTWTQIVVTFHATSGPDVNGTYSGVKTIYVNGAQVFQASGRSYQPLDNTPGYGLHIGAGRENGTDYYFNGSIDDVALFNSALSASTVQSYYNAVAVPEPASLAAGLVALPLLTLRRKR